MKTVLIANRGEIAVRIIRTCKKAGLKTVAVYSESDEGSMHARLADISVCIGPRQAEKSYLNMESILAAANAYHADLIHPGAGFLAESAAFRKACEDAGIIFIGPDAESMRLLGDKQKARQTMIENGFPVVPGSVGAVESLKDAIGVSKEIGFPLIIKAAKGGGGKGIRVIRDQKELDKEFAYVCREAAHAFGDKSVYIESYLENTKHIEVQILADEHGNTLHFGTRECSLQRKNQKLLEEAPVANVDADVLRHMQETAVNIAKCVGYKNAGTVEFLLTKDNKFYFMEMNTRIQVEHPVTESIFGIDLIKAQIQVALSHRFCINQEDIVPKGHAIECRINAEDVRENFRASPGVIKNMVLPGGIGVRIDTGYADGDEVSPFYDSMIMKVICTGDSRQEAIRLSLAALDELRLDGVGNNTEFAKAMLKDNDFITGNVHTKWIENVFFDRFMRGKS
ncbi:MAG: acetyl-CoA carboxylase biotin carboxylase subunit [Eubacteriales bacterium]|nr:acetyl-CoA carboxylase biotin carboxylase subunit [Eubacteriales bacterium]